jgi:hypothetical protein
MRTIAPLLLGLAACAMLGCGTARYRNVGLARLDPQASIPESATQVRGGLAEATPAGSPFAEEKPRRPAVPDEVMLKGQAEAGYRDSQVPY